LMKQMKAGQKEMAITAAIAHACKMGLEGIVSKRKDSTYRSGHSPDWVKMKNSSAYSAQCRQERLRSPSSTPSATVRR